MYYVCITLSPVDFACLHAYIHISVKTQHRKKNYHFKQVNLYGYLLGKSQCIIN